MMKFARLILILPVIPLLAAAHSTFPGKTWETVTPESEGVDASRLNQAMDLLEGICAEDGTEQVVVVRHGRIIWKGRHSNSWHNAFSCTKSFLSIATGLLVTDGKCQADTPLAGILPELRQDYPELTISHCLALTSGYVAKDRQFPFVPDTPLHPPGEGFRYGGESFNVLALALTRLAGESLEELFRRRIADPIGIGRRFEWGDFGQVDGLVINNGAGNDFRGIFISPENLARMGWLLLNQGNWDGRQLIDAEWVRLASSVHGRTDIPLHREGAWYTKIHGAYGLGFWVNGVREDGRPMWPSAPAGTFAIQGNYNNLCIIIPAWEMVLVRMGMDKAIDCDLYDGVLDLLGQAIQ